MDIRISSQDPEVYRLCHEVLAEIAPHRCRISEFDHDIPVEDPSLFIWDYNPEEPVPECVWSGFSKNLFLVDRKDVSRLQQTIGRDAGNIVLKPLTWATLSALLEAALGACHGPGATQPLPGEQSDAGRLAQTILRLQEYDQDRTTFLARAAHDLRTPLSALAGYCGLLLNEPEGTLTEPQREIVRRMQHSAKRLSRMATAMFELNVGHSLKRRPYFQRGDIMRCLRQALHEIAPLAEANRLIVTADLQPPEGSLYFEPGQIEQVLINILENACKFTPDGGAIEIHGYPYFWERRSGRPGTAPATERRQRVTRQPNAYRIDITDSGKPIPAEHLGRIFEEYTSVSRRQDRSGGGLGLAISRKILDQHSGRVWAENTEVGPTFCIVLPVRQRRAAIHSQAQTQKTAQALGGRS
jgi:signal transduction histidine kinase